MALQMRAWRFDRTGPIEQNLHLVDDLPRPGTTLQNGQVLIKIASASLNPADYKVPRMTISRLALQLPKTIGMDLSGTVDAVAPDVTAVKVGSRVMARLDPTKAPGSLAEYAVANDDGWVPISDDVGFDEAAGAGTTALTAYQALKGRVSQGDRVFINGGSGGVGTSCIQIAKIFGCQVTVTCSASKAELCKELGADHIIDYHTANVTQELVKSGPVFNLVIDNVGTSPLDLPGACHQYLKPDGRYVFVGAEPSVGVVKNIIRGMALPTILGGFKRKFEIIVGKDNKDDLGQIATWLGEKKLKTVVESAYDFEDAIAAYKHLQEGHSKGKVVVHVCR